MGRRQHVKQSGSPSTSVELSATLGIRMVSKYQHQSISASLVTPDHSLGLVSLGCSTRLFLFFYATRSISHRRLGLRLSTTRVIQIEVAKASRHNRFSPGAVPCPCWTLALSQSYPWTKLSISTDNRDVGPHSLWRNHATSGFDSSLSQPSEVVGHLDHNKSKSSHSTYNTPLSTSIQHPKASTATSRCIIYSRLDESHLDRRQNSRFDP